MTDTTNLPRLSADAFEHAPEREEREVPLPRLGGSVLVRSFSKATHIKMRREATVDGEIDENRLELLMFMHGVVDPEMTEEQAQSAFEHWDAGDVDAVLMATMEVSGLAQGVAATKRQFPDGPGDALPVPAST